MFFSILFLNVKYLSFFLWPFRAQYFFYSCMPFGLFWDWNLDAEKRNIKRETWVFHKAINVIHSGSVCQVCRFGLHLQNVNVKACLPLNFFFFFFFFWSMGSLYTFDLVNKKMVAKYLRNFLLNYSFWHYLIKKTSAN